MTTKVGIRELKQNASAVIRQLKETGEDITITEHGRPVARLVPAGDSYLDYLIATGQATPPKDPTRKFSSIKRVKSDISTEEILRDLRRDY